MGPLGCITSFGTVGWSDDIFKHQSIADNHALGEGHTICSIFLATCFMVGRMGGSKCQHSEHIPHHSSIKRKHVISALGRSGGPFMILNMVGTLPWMGWKGSSQVNSSCGDSVEKMGSKLTKAVIPNAHTSRAAVASPPSNISGASHGNVAPKFPGVDMLNEELVRSDRPKSVRRAQPSSDINTLSYNTPHQIESHCGDKQTHPFHISMVQWVRTAVMQVT